ncbi:MAG: hypothetical protein GY913_35675 [Proteobacteria bacterium]|nr:hypothetical protein [Pseudomonadota bacterium]MCP4922273.1 hypothetical protein [Pseudomonadota bacterium]
MFFLVACTSTPTDLGTDSSPDSPVDNGIWNEPCPVDEREQRRISVGDIELNVAEPYATDLVVETFESVDHWIEHRIPGEVAQAVRDLDAR